MERLYLWLRDDARAPSAVLAVFPPVSGRGAGLIITNCVMPVIVTLWTCLRVWTRRIKEISPLQTEDILCYLAVVSCRPPTAFAAEHHH